MWRVLTAFTWLTEPILYENVAKIVINWFVYTKSSYKDSVNGCLSWNLSKKTKNEPFEDIEKKNATLC